MSLGAKLGVTVVLVVTVASALVFVRFSERERASLVDAKRKAADMVADLFAATVSAPLDFGDEDGVQVELGHLRQNRDVTQAFVWREGEGAPFGKIASDAASVAGLAHDRAGTVVHESYVETVRTVIGRKKEPVGTALVRFSLTAEDAAWQVNRVQIFWLCAALALGTMGLLLVVTRRQVLVPLESLLGATRKLERGERILSIPVVANDEIGRLSRAFESMHAAVVDREEQLDRAHRRLRQLFDHMRQAILVFGADGRVEGSESRQTTHLFGGDLAGVSIRDLLYRGVGDWDPELRALDDWLLLAFQVDAESWSDVEALAPREVRLGGDDGERVLALEFRPIDEGSGRRIMLLATDETEKIRLKRDVVEQAERHAEQMAAMRRLVAGGGQQFVTFLETARRRLARANENAATPLDLPRLVEVFQDVHTLKSEARAFDLRELATVAAGLEELLSLARAELEGDPAHRTETTELCQGLGTAKDLLERAEQLFIDVSPTGRAVLDQVTVRRSDLDRICALAAKQGGELGRLSDRLAARSLGEVATPVAERAPGWASAVGKRVRVDLEGRDVLVPARLSQVLGGALAHLVRNAIAHGIELPEERERAGKPQMGLVRVSCETEGDAILPRIVVEDDGFGIDGNGLLIRAATDRTALDVAIARYGSFRPKEALRPPSDDLSGRGVGLSAVVRDLHGAGYAVHVARREGGGTRFDLVPLPPPGRT